MSREIEDGLASRFCVLWQRCCQVAVEPDSEQVWQELARHYTQPRRYYHNLNHIAHCLANLDLVAHLDIDHDAIELAIWFHDVIYAVRRDDNEARSAQLFQRLAQSCMAEPLTDRVSTLINATQHIQPAADVNCQYMVDIDLSSFGLDWNAFRTDSDHLRAEQQNESDQDFYTAKLRFMEMLTRRGNIFQTEFFRRQLETRARANIERYSAEIAKLLQQPPEA